MSTQSFVLRSGYVVPFDAGDALGSVEHLVTAIFTETLQAFEGEPTLEGITEAIVAEATHVAHAAPPMIARAMFAGLLSGAVFDCLRRVSGEYNLACRPTARVQ